MSSSNEPKLTRRSVVRTILVTLLIAFPSGGIELGQRGRARLRQIVELKPGLAPQQRTWTQNQIEQLAPQTQVASLSSETTGNHGAEIPIIPESIAILDIAAKELQQRHLLLPLRLLTLEKLRDSFNDARGSRTHQAIDIPALRNTPVLAVEDGSIARLWYSVPGGITIYQFDPRKEYEYYYAHLESYAQGLKEGDHVDRGQVIGYVGTSGNAPKNTPHLHFSIFKLTESKDWWQGTAVNPYLVFRVAHALISE